MPSWVYELIESGALLPTALVIFALSIMLIGMVKMYPVISKLVAIINVLAGTPGKPGLVIWQQEQTKLLKSVQDQVRNHHKTNLRDDVDELASEVKTLAATVADMKPLVEQIHWIHTNEIKKD